MGLGILFGFRAWGLGQFRAFRVEELFFGCKVWALGFRVSDTIFRWRGLE